MANPGSDPGFANIVSHNTHYEIVGNNPPVSIEDEIPFEIPESWSWVRLSDISSTNIGLTYHPEDVVENGTIVVRSCNIINSKIDYTDKVKVRTTIKNNQYLNNNDIVICARNGSKALVGKCAIFEGKSGTVSFGAFMAVLRTSFYKYVFYYLHTDSFRRYFQSDDSKQINQVTQSILKEAYLPFPPLSEQQRIVNKINQVFSALDSVDALQAQYADNLNALKKTILQEAIMGKLVPQDPNDEPASALLERIRAERERLIAEGKIKHDKNESRIYKRGNSYYELRGKSEVCINNEFPFEIPENWVWVRLSDISSTNIGLTYHPEDIVENGTIVVRSCNIISSKIDYSDIVKVKTIVRDNQYLNNNDIVICARNGSKALVGKCAIFKGESGSVSFGAFMAVLRTSFYDYVFYYLHTDAFRRYFQGDDSKQINQVTQSILKEAFIPLPPLSEQRRIVSKIENILSEVSSL